MCTESEASRSTWQYVFVWVFVMHIFVRMTIHIICLRHAHVYTIDYRIIFLCCFVMYMFVRMTMHCLVCWFSLCTFLYEWLFISFESVVVILIFFTNDYPFPFVWVFFMHIFVRMTIHLFWMGVRHAHVWTSDYHFSWICFLHVHAEHPFKTSG